MHKHAVNAVTILTQDIQCVTMSLKQISHA